MVRMRRTTVFGLIGVVIGYALSIGTGLLMRYSEIVERNWSEITTTKQGEREDRKFGGTLHNLHEWWKDSNADRIPEEYGLTFDTGTFTGGARTSDSDLKKVSRIVSVWMSSDDLDGRYRVFCSGEDPEPRTQDFKLVSNGREIVYYDINLDGWVDAIKDGVVDVEPSIMIVWQKRLALVQGSTESGFYVLDDSGRTVQLAFNKETGEWSPVSSEGRLYQFDFDETTGKLEVLELGEDEAPQREG